jgi:ubiquinone biosynthesis protein
VHFEAGYVPAHQDVESFAQALRAVGEPVLGRAATEVSMGRLLTQLFEITAQFDMHLRPELVLLQKTMVSVEGVSRSIYPDHNLWEAARPVVKAWISRELSPLAEARRLFDQLATRLRSEDAPATVDAQELDRMRSRLNTTQAVAVVSLIVAMASLAMLVWYVVK